MTMESYFIRVSKQTPTKFWINNPTRSQTITAIENGALGCTCNPSYSQKMVDLPEEGPYALSLLNKACQESDNDKSIAEIFQRKLVKPIAEHFLSIYKRSSGIN